MDPGHCRSGSGKWAKRTDAGRKVRTRDDTGTAVFLVAKRVGGVEGAAEGSSKKEKQEVDSVVRRGSGFFAGNITRRDISADLLLRADVHRVHSVYRAGGMGKQLDEEGKMTKQERSKEICERLEEIAAELRGLCLEIGRNIHIITTINTDKKTASVVYAAKYRMDHFYEGQKRLSYEGYTVDPERVIFGALPRGLETMILEKELKRQKKRK